MLTQRAKRIIMCITRFPADCAITLSMIADEIGSSTRSVQRELPDIEKWMLEHGYHFERKRGQGLLLHESQVRMKEIRSTLNEANPSGDIYSDRDIRQDALLKELLFSDEPIKAAYFCHRYSISEKTLSTDLNKAAEQLAHFHLDLIRKPGLGVYVAGPEAALRRAYTNLIRKEMTEAHISQTLHRKELPLTCRQVPFLDLDLFLRVSEILTSVENDLHLCFPDQDYIVFLLYLTISLQRIECGNGIHEMLNSFEDIYREPEHAVAEYIADKIKHTLEISLSSIEICYITVALTGTHIWPSTKNNYTESSQIDLHQLILDIVGTISSSLQIDLSQDRNLITDLTNHLKPMIGRLRAGIPIDNPLVSIMKEEYSDIFEACCKAKPLFSQELGISDIPDSEIGFLTMHFGAALERLNHLKRKINAVVVCPSGIGTSRLLAATIQKEYPDLQLMGVQSILSLQPDELRSRNVDLIISTVPLHIDYPFVQVSPILNKQDILLLNARLDQIADLKTTIPKLPFDTSTDVSWSDIEYLKTLGEEIRYTLDHVSMGRAPVLHKKEEVISYSASLFAENEEMEKHFMDVIMQREELGDTYIKAFHTLLLHGKTDATDHGLFGYIALKPPVYERGRMILGAIVSFIPETDNNPVYAQVISEIIGSLIDNTQLLNALREADLETFLFLLEKLLLNFYRREAADRLSLLT